MEPQQQSLRENTHFGQIIIVELLKVEQQNIISSTKSNLKSKLNFDLIDVILILIEDFFLSVYFFC